MRKKICFFSLFVFWADIFLFFCFSPSPPLSRFELWSLFFIFRAPHCTPAHQTSHTCGSYTPPASCTFCDCPAHPLPPEIARVAPPNPSFCFPLGPISKGCSTTACSAVGAGMSKVPPQPPYLSPPSISLTLTSLFLFGSQIKAQHFPAWKVVRLPQDPPRSHFGVFCTFSCSAVFPLSLPTLLHPPPLCLHVLSPTNCYFSRLTVVFLSF